ncbi:MAG: nitrous oxide-stimulated promoter family protein [Coriobacteriia bacterium]|nr:nitrous oxide-stimulated promoter family protein [Coriobacteriia bacterium]
MKEYNSDLIDVLRQFPHMPKPDSKLETKLFERLKDDEVLADCATLGLMTEIYCKDHHDKNGREALYSPASVLGAYEGKRHPKLCPECADHVIYGETRRALCSYDPKPNCKSCKTHCYKADQRAHQRKVMAYSGPRAMLYPHLWVDTFRHLRNKTKN